MPAHRLAIGEHGDITYRTRGSKVTASFYYRNLQGHRRRIEATADSKAAARRAALGQLAKAMSAGESGEYTSRTSLGDVAERWYEQVAELAESGRRSPTTVALYRRVLDRHVLPGIGSLRLNELTPARLDQFLHQTRRQRGYPIAKVCRSILSGVCGFAVRGGGLQSNPVRDVGRLEGQARQARALTPQECRKWLTILDNDPPPTISIDDVTHAEGNSGTTLFVFTVTLSSTSGRSITIDYSTVDGTATSPADYVTQSGQLTFLPGTTSATISIAVNGDE